MVAFWLCREERNVEKKSDPKDGWTEGCLNERPCQKCGFLLLFLMSLNHGWMDGRKEGRKGEGEQRTDDWAARAGDHRINFSNVSNESNRKSEVVQCGDGRGVCRGAGVVWGDGHVGGDVHRSAGRASPQF